MFFLLLPGNGFAVQDPYSSRETLTHHVPGLFHLKGEQSRFFKFVSRKSVEECEKEAEHAH
jgi:hypothetical protein